MKTYTELLHLLTRRVERLIEEYNMKAPTIIIKNELRLINDACQKLYQLNK